MVSTKSDSPKRKSGEIKIDSTGISFNWRITFVIIALLFGGGSVFGWGMLPEKSEVSQIIDSHEKGPAHARLEMTLTSHGKKIDGNTTAIRAVSEQLGDVQDTQRHAYARQEARRVTANIKSRAVERGEYDRIYRLNVYRLMNNKEPCANLDCSN